MIKKEIRTKIDELMGYVNEYLIRKWGEVTPVWQLSLIQIHDLFFVYLEARADILKRGVNVEDRYGHLKPNQSLFIMTQAMTKLDALFKGFGLNPLSNARLCVNTDKGLDNLALDALMMVDNDEKHE